MNESEPKQEYLSLTEDDVRAALRDPDETNPIRVEFNRLVGIYIENLEAHFARFGHIPPAALRPQPRCPIEAVAFGNADDVLKFAIQEYSRS